MIDLSYFPPAVLFLLAALLLPTFKNEGKNWFMILVSGFSFYLVWQLPMGSDLKLTFLGYELELLRVDRLSKAFGYIFCLNGFAAAIYAYYLRDPMQQISTCVYVGSALGVVFAGDLLSLYMFWEMMAISSTFLILARRTDRAYGAAFRYVMVHIFGGLVLLAGIVITIQQTGETRFDPELLSQGTVSSWLILVGFLINAAAPPLASWLPDAYPEATVTGGVILSAYTSKTAVYTLIRGFPGWEILIGLGCIMAIYGIVYALLENDMRRILAYSIINQVGFMVAGIGIGSEMAINGAVAHAFCHIIYKALLWMSAGAVLHMTGKSKCTELGGLYKTMPWTMILGTIGALAISSVPGTSGFTSKSLIIQGAADSHFFWPWLVLEIASAGVFLHAGIKFPYFVFFAKDRGLRPGETNRAMLLAMAFLAFFCIFLGVYPDPLYAILPYQEMFTDGHFSVFKLGKIVTQSQLLIFSGLVFFLFLPLLKRTPTISLDFDWFYRAGGAWMEKRTAMLLNGLNSVTQQVLVKNALRHVFHFFRHGPSRIIVGISRPFMMMSNKSSELPRLQRSTYRKAKLGSLPIGITAFTAVLLLFLIYFL